MCNFIRNILYLPLWRNPRIVMTIWMVLAIIASITKKVTNNYLIYKYSFYHLINQEHMYCHHPTEYNDLHHYGPIFSVLIAPFALLPDLIGVTLWHLSLALFLCWAIKMTRFPRREQLFILWFCMHELLTALFMSQINVAIAGMVLLSFCFIKQEKEIWATFFIAFGTFIKLFGIVGLAFFFFSKHKRKFMGWLLFWSVIMFIIPMFFSSPTYVLSQYSEWYYAIADKSYNSHFTDCQNISLLGMIRKIGYAFHLGYNDYMSFFNAQLLPTEKCFWTTYPDSPLVVCGVLLFILPYFRFQQWRNLAYQKMFLASSMMFLCLFSTSSESSGYIIALIGVVIWYTAIPWERGWWDKALMVLVFILTSMSPSDLIPSSIRYGILWPFALKALPVTICWFRLQYEMLTKNYEVGNVITNTDS